MMSSSASIDSTASSQEDELEIFRDDVIDKLKHNVYAEVASYTLGSTDISSPMSMHNGDSSTDTNENEKDKLLRKQRNRMHAKLSRDRRKLFATKISEMISRLETRNQILQRRLDNTLGFDVELNFPRDDLSCLYETATNDHMLLNPLTSY
jgi:hypothetical protein